MRLPAQPALNSGRKVMTSKTGRRRTRSTVRSSSSREVGSIQCASSNTIKTGRPAPEPRADEQRLEQLFALALRAQIELGGASSAKTAIGEKLDLVGAALRCE